MKLSRLIKHLQNVENKYGDMSVFINDLDLSRDITLASLCVSIDSDYEEETKHLAIEIEDTDPNWKPVFRVYEYPSNEDINLEP